MPRHPRVTDLVSDWLVRLLPRTRAAYARDLAVFTAWLAPTGRPLLAATAADVERFRDHQLLSGVSAATVNRRLSAIGSLFRHALECGACPTNPVAQIPRAYQETESTTTVLSPVTCDAIWAAARRAGTREALIVALLLYDGLKLSEVLAIEIGHLRGTALLVHRRGVHQSIEPDGRTAALLVTHVGRRTEGPLLQTGARGRDGGPLTRYGAHFTLRRVGELAGLADGLTSNQLRASYVANARAGGLSTRTISARMGHADPRTTRRLMRT